MASIESETTVRPIRDETDFAFLLGYAMGRDDANGNREGLLQLLDRDGLTEDMIGMLFDRALQKEDYSEMTEQLREGIIRICLRLIALHCTSMHFKEDIVVALSICLHMVMDFSYSDDEEEEQKEKNWQEERFVEMLHNEHFIPFLFQALRTSSVEENRNDVAELACLMINLLWPSNHVTLIVRYWPLLPEIFMAGFGVDKEREAESLHYGNLYQREFAGLIATTPSLLDKLLTTVNDPHEDNDGALDVLMSLLTTTLATSPLLLEHLLGCGLLTALVSVHARKPLCRVGIEDDDAATIRAVLAEYPCWTQAVKRIAAGVVEEVNDRRRTIRRRPNAVIEMAKALPSRHTTGEVEYNLL